MHPTGRGTARIEARHYLVATGAEPWAPPIDGLDRVGYLTSTTAMDLDTPPASMIVIGGNAVGLEQAQLFARLGTRVTVVEALPRPAPFDEPEASAVIHAVFAEEGITVHTAAQATATRRDGDQVVLTVHGEDGDHVDLRAERLLVAKGRRPVRVSVEPDQVTSIDPATAVVSIVTPDTCATIRTAFCNQVHFFASPDAAQPRLDQHPGATVLPVTGAFALGGPLTQTLLTDDGDNGCC